MVILSFRQNVDDKVFKSLMSENIIFNIIFKPNCVQDGNGFIDRQELAIMLRFMGENVSEQEIRDIIEEADVDKDGLIDYSEFYNMMCCAKKTPAGTGSTQHHQ